MPTGCKKELDCLSYYRGQFHCLSCDYCMGNTQEKANKELELVEEPKFDIYLTRRTSNRTWTWTV